MGIFQRSGMFSNYYFLNYIYNFVILGDSLSVCSNNDYKGKISVHQRLEINESEISIPTKPEEIFF